MIGQRAIYHKHEVTIVGYMEWGQPLKVQYYWIKFSTGEMEKVRASSVRLCK